jgi:hypothetical protein
MQVATLTAAASKWDVREGVADDLAPDLKNDRTEVLAFLAHGEDEASRRIKFGVLRQVAGILDKLVDDRRTGRLQALIEALTPDIELSSTRIIEARMLSSARTAVLKSQDFVTASAIADAAHFSSKNPSSQPNRWKKGGLVFAISYKGTDLYPLYALDHKHGFRPVPVIAEILNVFDGTKDAWETAFWFESLNSHLSDKKPKDLIATKPEAVLKAAQVEAAGLQHG